MKYIVNLILIINFLLLTGCATVHHVSLKKENKEKIKTVYIDPSVKTPEKMVYAGDGAKMKSHLPLLIGMTLAGSRDEDMASIHMKNAKYNNIYIDKIINKQWRKQANTSHLFKLTDKPSDVILTMEIIRYGLVLDNLISSDYKPMLEFNAVLKKDGKVLWQKSGNQGMFYQDMPRYDINKILSDPKLLYVMWDKAAEKIVKEMLDDMNK